jgi:molybdopterin converting factor small subunit
MPTVTVRLFASLAETEGWREKICALPSGATARDAWVQAVGRAAVPPRTLAAINLDYHPLDTPLGEGDEVAFFPPVTGG